MTTWLVDGVPVAADDVRFDYQSLAGVHHVVCGRHQQWAQNRCEGGFLSRPVTPGPEGPEPCVACRTEEPVELYPVDERGLSYCGQDFMAGTICTLPPEHDGPHAPVCQVCDGDWYEGACTCDVT